MGLFERKANNYTTSSDYYSMGQNKTMLVIGLGNIGKEYANNRHNVGFIIVDRFAQKHDFSSWIEKKDLKCYIASGMIADTKVILIKPTTLMNNSGEAAQAVQAFYKIKSDQTVIVHDELDIDFGQLRIRNGGGSAGHNGLKSLIAHIGPDFGRIRIGIGPKTHEQMDSADFVLQDFSQEQAPKLKNIVKEACSILDEYTATQKLEEETRSVL